METVALFVLGPVVVLALLSAVSVLACRRLHRGRLQRLQEFDTEQGAVDGLITSNVGDSTLAVSGREVLGEEIHDTENTCSSHPALTVCTVCTPLLPKCLYR